LSNQLETCLPEARIPEAYMLETRNIHQHSSVCPPCNALATMCYCIYTCTYHTTMHGE